VSAIQPESQSRCFAGTDTAEQSRRGFRALPAESRCIPAPSELLFDYNQALVTHALQMLDSDPVSLGNSQELTLGLPREGPATQDFASRLSLSLDHTQESDAGMGVNDLL